MIRLLRWIGSKITVGKEEKPIVTPMHPSKMLTYILEVRDIKAIDFAEEAGIPQNAFEDFMNCEIGITPDLAEKFAGFFNVSADFWLNMQKGYEAECRDFACKNCREK